VGDVAAAGGGSAQAQILVVAEHRLFRDLVRGALEGGGGLRVAACASSPPEALEILASRPIDLVLADADGWGGGGLEFPAQARRAGYEGPVLVLAGRLSQGESVELVRHGVAGILLKDEPIEALLECVRQVLRGGPWVDRRTLEALLCSDRQGGTSESRLSEREREVLRAVAQGLATKEIAAQLKLSESTVKAVVRRLFDKTGVRNRSQLVRIALERYRPLV